MSGSQVDQCPHCGTELSEGQVSPYCPSCRKSLPAEIADRLYAKFADAKKKLELSPDTPPAAGEPQSKSPVVTRYRDAYRVGHGIVTIGNTIKAIGAIVGVLGFLVSLNLGDFALGGILLGAVFGGLFWVCGVIVNSHGQTLIATLDTAVASSRFLTDGECAEAMGLGKSVIRRNEVA